MIETETHSLESIVIKGRNEARRRMERVLISFTEKVEEADPLLVFERMRKLEGDRSFFKSATEPFYLLTVGENLTITAEDADRYDHSFKGWSELKERAISYNPFDQEGTGLLITGGMSFDVLEERTTLWERYPASEFILPEFVFTKMEGDHYLTMISFVSEGEDIAKKLAELKRKKRILLEGELSSRQKNTILSKTEIKPEEWKESVGQAIKHIQEGRAEKIVMARELRVKLDKGVEITPILHRFLDLQRTSYLFAYERGDHCFIGATPERLIKVQGRKLLSTCLAGTAPRGRTEEEDLRIKDELFHDEKNRLEHDHVVQMIGQSIEDYCSYLHIPDLPQVITLKDLQHLYTPVEGELKEGYSVFDIIRKLHPTPALGGAPTEEALAFIRDYEDFERGWYGSPVGWLDDRHNGEFAVAIRSGLIRGDEISLFAGCGVMGDSDIDLEFEETRIKFLPMLTALEDEDDSY